MQLCPLATRHVQSRPTLAGARQEQRRRSISQTKDGKCSHRDLELMGTTDDEQRGTQEATSRGGGKEDARNQGSQGSGAIGHLH